MTPPLEVAFTVFGRDPFTFANMQHPLSMPLTLL
jgi:hypothetical protein